MASDISKGTRPTESVGLFDTMLGRMRKIEPLGWAVFAMVAIAVGLGGISGTPITLPPVSKEVGWLFFIGGILAAFHPFVEMAMFVIKKRKARR